MTYGSVRGLEAVELGLRARLELILGDHGLEHLGGNVPELLVVLVQEDDDARRLRVERRGRVEDDLVDNLNNLLVRLGSLLVELVDGAALLDGIEEALGGSHGRRCGGKGGVGCGCAWGREDGS